MNFSVVLPNFNHGKLLPRAVAALMAQSPAPAEIIIINDGSADDSLSTIEKLKMQFPCIRLINHVRNEGVVASMNEGLKAATEALVLFAAADDYSLPGFFAAAKSAFEHHPEAAFFCGRVVLVDPSGRILGFRPFMQPASRSMMVSPSAARSEFVVSDNWSVGPSVIYRRHRLIEAGGFDENMGSFTDGIVVRRLALESGFYFDSAIVAACECHPESLSARAALSPAENKRLVATAITAVKASFPADIREAYADRLERRLLFNMARLGLLFDEGRIDTDLMGSILQFKGLARTGLGISARLPFSRLAVLTWMAIILQPYGLSAVLTGWYRAIKSRAFETTAVSKVIADARSRSI
jgi:glycosyltransferase involved in cell wall biosynthesis